MTGKKGLPAWNKGRKWPNEVKQKISQTMQKNHRMHSWTEEELREWSRSMVHKRKLKTLHEENR